MQPNAENKGVVRPESGNDLETKGDDPEQVMNREKRRPGGTLRRSIPGGSSAEATGVVQPESGNDLEMKGDDPRA